MTAARFGPFDFDLSRIARLLIYFLVRSGFVLDVELGRSFGFEEEDLRFRGNTMVNLVHNRSAEFEALQVGRFPVGVSAGENALTVGQTSEEQVGADELFLGQLNDLVMAVFEDQQDFVELRAFDLEFLAGDFVADVAGFAVVGDFERFEGDFFRIDFVVAAGFGEARIERTVFCEQRFQMSDDVFGEVLEVFTSLAEIAFGFFDLFAMLVDVEEGDSANADLKQAVNIWIGQFADEFLFERFEAVIDRRDNRFVGFALFDFLVDPFFDENAFESAEMQIVEQFLFSEFEFALESFNELIGISAEDVGDSHLDRAIISDDCDSAGDGDFAIGKCVKCIHQFFRRDTAGGFDLNFDVFGGEIVDAFDFDFAFARGVLDGTHQRFGCRCGRDFGDGDGGLVFDFDFGANLDFACAVFIAAGVHEAAGLKIGQALKRLLFQDGNLRFEQLGEIVRQNAGGHADGDAFSAEHEEKWQFARENDGFFIAAIVAGDEISYFVIEELGSGQFAETAFDVTRSGRWIASKDISIVTLLIDQIAFVSQHHERITD